MTSASRLITAALAASAAGCSGVPDEPFRIDIVMGDRCADSCADYSMNCTGILSVRIVEAEFPDVPDAGPGEDAGVAEEPALAHECRSFTGADLCSLDTVSIAFQDIPARMVRIQVAVWSEDELGGDDQCPRHNIFGVNPIGGTDFDPRPAVAGWGYFDLSEVTVAEVEVQCDNPDQLRACEDESTLVNAQVENLESLVFVDTATAEDLRVSVAAPLARQNEITGELEHVMPAEDFELTLDAERPVPSWFGTVDQQFQSVACVEVINRIVPQATASVVCKQTSPGEPFLLNGPSQQSPAAQAASYVPRAILDDILAAAGLASFPERGLVIGRVIDHLGSPERDVTVDAETLEDPLDGQILYLESDRLGFNDVATSDNGYFIAQDVPFGTRWTALSNDGRGHRGEYVTGLVVGKITVLVIRLEPQPIQP